MFRPIPILYLLTSLLLWSAPELRFNIPSAGAVYLPLPQELRGQVTDCQATVKQKTIPSRPLTVDGRVCGFVLDFAGHSPNNAAVATAKLLEQPRNSPVDHITGCVRLTRKMRSVTTRPFTAEEMARTFDHFHRPGKPGQRARVNAFGEVPEGAKWRFPDKKNSLSGMLLWEALMPLEAPAQVCFGADQEHVAWAVFVNGHPAAEWSTAEHTPGFCHGQAIALPAGLHCVQFFVIHRQNETIPKLLVSVEGTKAIPPPSTIPFTIPTRLEADGCAAAYEITSVHHLPQTQSTLVAATVNVQDKARFLDAKGQELPCMGSQLRMTHGNIPGIRLESSQGGLTFPAIECRPIGLRLELRLRLGDTPNLLAASSELPCQIALESIQPGELPWQDIQLESEFLAAGGTQVKRVLHPLPKETILHLSPPPKTNIIRMRAMLDSIPLTSAICLRLIHPQDDFSPLKAVGKRLLYDEQRAVLLCDRLAPLPPLPAQRETIVLDCFSDDSSAPGATTPIAPPPTIRIPVIRMAGNTSETALLATLPRLLATAPSNAILLPLPPNPSDAPIPAQNLLTLLFLAQACHSHGIAPTLVTMPLTSQSTPAGQRLLALYTKELALALGVPIIDLFSRQKQLSVSTIGWYADQDIGLATPSDQARSWLHRQLLRR